MAPFVWRKVQLVRNERNVKCEMWNVLAKSGKRREQQQSDLFVVSKNNYQSSIITADNKTALSVCLCKGERERQWAR